MMSSIEVYDPAMCCSTGVCGPDVDPLLAQFAGWLAQLKERGVTVTRHGLSQNPMAFVQKTEVKALLEKDGTAVLPLIFIDGELRLSGRYPEAEERKGWVGGSK